MSELESLENYNARKREEIRKKKERRGNGIACPACGTELYDIIGIIYTSNPPQLGVECSGCGYRGLRVYDEDC